MKKLIKIFSVLPLVILLVSFSAGAFDGNIDEYKNTTGDELFSAMDSNTERVLSSFGIDSLDFSKIYSVSPQSLSSYFGNTLKEKVKESSAVFFELLLSVMITALAQNVFSAGESDMFDIVCAAAVCVMSVSGINGALNSVVSVLSLSGSFLKAFVPILAGIVALSGSPSAALTYNTLTLGFAEVISFFSNTAAVGITGAFLCLSIAFSMNGAVNLGRFISAFGKCVSTALGFISSLFAGILGVKGTLSASLDRAGVKSVRFLISSMIPIVGSSISEAYSSIVGSINLIKGSVAAVGILSAVIINTPAVIQALLCCASMNMLSFVSETLSCQRISSLFRCFACAVKVLLLLLVFEMFLLIISTGLVLSFKGGD